MLVCGKLGGHLTEIKNKLFTWLSTVLCWFIGGKLEGHLTEKKLFTWLSTVLCWFVCGKLGDNLTEKELFIWLSTVLCWFVCCKLGGHLTEKELFTCCPQCCVGLFEVSLLTTLLKKSCLSGSPQGLFV